MENRLKKICTQMHPIRTQLEKMTENFFNNPSNSMSNGNLSRYMPVNNDKKRAYSFNPCKPLFLLVGREGIEPSTY
jgi:hypothetical protein